ncbi:GGDEF domain-containing protein [Kineosporia sp. J2-2]|uniref:GGDEF domain-containing protein n=1 Tax=Kineosporia corallincola TaxID=2835133 RepID=A0ABS5TTV7_9ACTN|nr:GGDEF domain-containing protein [Kineosporia corallincola]MBT0774174.1 GGDEF domain-containing protein [Kineosporia corallincola]
MSAVVLAWTLVSWWCWQVMQRLSAEAALARRQARTDPLTGLGNRSALDDVLNGDRAPVSMLAIVDLDGFKAINDTHGHHVGDYVLTTVAARLDAVMAGAGHAIRLGGDEFALLWQPHPSPPTRCRPETACAATGTPCSHHAVAANPNPTPDTDVAAPGPRETAERVLFHAVDVPILWSGQRLAVDASLGLVTNHDHQLTGQQLMHMADEAMYVAKRREGNVPVPGEITRALNVTPLTAPLTAPFTAPGVLSTSRQPDPRVIIHAGLGDRRRGVRRT